ncbi:MAG: EF-hand domain-containing protein [Pseudomonadota bacterium]
MTKKTVSFATHRAFVLAALGVPLVILGAGSAAAQSADEVEALLKQADANRDGQVTWAEVVELRTKMFSRLDRNGDGYADKSDRPRMFGSKFDQAMTKAARFDADGDGRISKAEMIEAEAPAFTKADANGDKIVTTDEISAARSAQ